MIKLRLVNGKIFLSKEYAYFSWSKLREIGVNLSRENIEEKFQNLQMEISDQSQDFLLEVYYVCKESQTRVDEHKIFSVDALNFEVSKIIPLDEKELNKGKVVDFSREKMSGNEIGILNEALHKSFLNLFFINKGILYYFKNCLIDPLAIYGLFLLKEELAVKEINLDGWEKLFSNDTEEIFEVNSIDGVYSVRKINNHLLGNSRFYARKLRKILKERRGYL